MSAEPVSQQPPAETAGRTSSEIGPRLAAYRTERGIRVSALARAVGVSASLISQIERGQSRPSVSTLLALAEALELPVDAFFRDARGDGREGPGLAAPEPANGGARPDRDGGQPAPHDTRHRPGEQHTSRYLVRRGEREAIDIEGGVRWERLTPTQIAEVEFMELVYSPHAESHGTQYRHPGMEMVLVLEGRLDIHVGFEYCELEAGDSMCFPSTVPHRYLNPTEQTTRAVTTILPDRGIPGPPTTNRRP